MLNVASNKVIKKKIYMYWHMEVKAETRQSVPYGMSTRTHFFYLQNQITTDLIKLKKKTLFHRIPDPPV